MGDIKSKIVFTTHINDKGRLQEGKESVGCPHCNGQCYVKYYSVSPSLVQTFEYECTDCEKIWTENY